MAYTDKNLVLSGGVSVDGAITYQTPAATLLTLSTNIVDLGSLIVTRDLGEGNDLYLRAQIGAAFTGLTALEIQIITADDTSMATNLTVIGSTGPIPVASLTAGARFAANINPRIGSKGQRYLGARFSVTGTSTAGNAFVDIGMDIQDGQKFYPNGFAVL